jgi:hypothetical protein
MVFGRIIETGGPVPLGIDTMGQVVMWARHDSWDVKPTPG